jgi:hypothetical protein
MNVRTALNGVTHCGIYDSNKYIIASGFRDTDVSTESVMLVYQYFPSNGSL